MSSTTSSSKVSGHERRKQSRGPGKLISCLLVVVVVLGIYIVVDVHYYYSTYFLSSSSLNNNKKQQQQQSSSSSSSWRSSSSTRKNDKKNETISTKSKSQSSSLSFISSFLVPRPNIPTKIFKTWHQEMIDLGVVGNVTTTLPCIINRTEAKRNLFSLRVQDSASDSGLLFVKIEKAGSSTLAGIVGRLSELIYRRHSQQGLLRNEYLQPLSEKLPSRGYTNACKCRGMSHKWGFHSQRVLFREDQRLSNNVTATNQRRQKRFLWSVIRHPETRILSQYFHFEVSRKNASTSDQDIIEYIQKKKWWNRQMQYLYPFPKQVLTVTEYDDIEKRLSTFRQLIQYVLNTYNFIGTLERLDETLVILSFLLNLKLTDVIPLSAKRSTRQKELDMNGNGQCNTYTKAFVSEGVRSFLESYPKFLRHHEVDYMMYDAINTSMDLTIEKTIGRDTFNKALEEFRRLKQYAHDQNCTYINPCIREGVMRSWKEINQMCYLGDAGCGHKCLDQLFPE